MAFSKLALVLTIALVLTVGTLASNSPKPARRLVLNGVGSTADELRPTVDLFNELLGGEDNGSGAGPLKSGRRSINWDAGVVPFKFPGDFFAKNVTRGLTVKNSNNKFRVSNPVPSNGDDKFSKINPLAAADFITFSSKRLFAPVKDTKVVVKFSVPGKHQAALVRGFGAVFVDVDYPHLTKAVYYDKYGRVLTTQAVDAQKNGLSFLGVIFDEPVISRVALFLGSRPLRPLIPPRRRLCGSGRLFVLRAAARVLIAAAAWL
ncbi:MAG: hypothetical protein AAGJ80_15955 [Cyanobacteria bacterium J06553_1]